MTFVARTQRRYQQETRTYHSPGSGTPEPIAGEWGHLRLLQEIGRGGFGSVYRAFDPTLEREVALKVFHTVWPGAPKCSPRGGNSRKVRHSNVVQVSASTSTTGARACGTEAGSPRSSSGAMPTGVPISSATRPIPSISGRRTGYEVGPLPACLATSHRSP